MVPYGGIEPTTSQFVAECSVRYTNRAFEIGCASGFSPFLRQCSVCMLYLTPLREIGTSRGIRTLNLQSLNLTQLPVMLPRHLKLNTSHRLPTTIRLYFLNRLMAFSFNKDILVKLVLQEVVATSRIIRLKGGYPSTVASGVFEIFGQGFFAHS